MSQESNGGNENQGGFNPGNRAGRSGGRSNRSRNKWNRSNRNTKHKFNGKKSDMNGNVFQLQAERKQKGQFQDTLEQLQVYASANYKKEIFPGGTSAALAVKTE